MNRLLGFLVIVLSGGALAAEGAPAGAVAVSSERDYFAELPVVLTVSRLAQPLDETPGAVTIIDREMIHLSGARNVAELLRFVPGFQVSDSFELVGPLVAYHGAISSFANQMQVLIDGRSVYASYVVGSVAPGLQSVALEDVERIEVLRGSNSAAYGARAFLGVVNIITRDPATTRGVAVSVRNGEGGVADDFVRAGWGRDNANFRLSAGQRSDDGLKGASGGTRLGHVNLRADLRLSGRDELQLRAGASEQDAGVGVAGTPGNLPRNRHLSLGYAQADWRRALGPDQDLAFSYAHGEERYVDHFAFPTATPGLSFFGAPIDSGGLARNDTLGAQHTFRAGEGLRVVWGAEFRQEAIRSIPLYNTDAWLTSNFRRLYGNVEWRMSPALLLNVGGMHENTSIAGSSFAPRAMLNWHVMADHTLRFGVSKAYRPPSIYEMRADVRFASTTPPNAVFIVTDVSRGRAKSESLLAKEIGYLGEFRQIGLTADVRIFHEWLDGLLRRQEYPVAELNDPRLIGLNSLTCCAREFLNSPGFPVHGYEYQLQFRPRSGTRVIYSHASIYISSPDLSIYTAAPKRSDSIAWFQKLPGDLDFSLMYFEATSLPWLDGAVPGQWRRTDARLGKVFRIAGNKLDLAVVVQNIGPPYHEYPSDQNQRFERRAFLTLGLEL